MNRISNIKENARFIRQTCPDPSGLDTWPDEILFLVDLIGEANDIVSAAMEMIPSESVDYEAWLAKVTAWTARQAE